MKKTHRENDSFSHTESFGETVRKFDDITCLFDLIGQNRFTNESSRVKTHGILNIFTEFLLILADSSQRIACSITSVYKKRRHL